MSVLLTRLTNLDKRLKGLDKRLKPVLVAKVNNNGWYYINSLCKTFKSKAEMNKFLEKVYKNQKFILIIDNISEDF